MCFTMFRYMNKAKIDLSDYVQSGTWDIIKGPGKLNVYNATEWSPKKTDITFHIVIRRKTLFYTGKCPHNARITPV